MATVAVDSVKKELKNKWTKVDGPIEVKIIDVVKLKKSDLSETAKNDKVTQYALVVQLPAMNEHEPVNILDKEEV